MVHPNGLRITTTTKGEDTHTVVTHPDGSVVEVDSVAAAGFTTSTVKHVDGSVSTTCTAGGKQAAPAPEPAPEAAAEKKAGEVDICEPYMCAAPFQEILIKRRQPRSRCSEGPQRLTGIDGVRVRACVCASCACVPKIRTRDDTSTASDWVSPRASMLAQKAAVSLWRPIPTSQCDLHSARLAAQW